MAWCRHDNQHILGWAAWAVRGYLDLWSKVEWLAGILAARDFPLSRLARNLDLAAQVVTEERPEDGEELARELRACAERVRHLPASGSGP